MRVTGVDPRLERVVAIVQARMGSTRLPGKVLALIAGRTMLDRVVTRVGRSVAVDDVIVATSTLAQDDAIVEHCQTLGVRVERGDPLDVLTRYAHVVRNTEADVVVRITGDCPFIDPSLVSIVVASLLETDGADYAANVLEPRTFPRGLDVEAMTASALLEADALDGDPGRREHVTPFIRDSGRYRLVGTRHHQDLSFVRWTVDTSDDLELACVMAEHFGGSDDTTWTDLLSAWMSHPSWQPINAHVEQKKVIPL